MSTHLLPRFCPVFQFHSKEVYFPASFDYAVCHADLYSNTTKVFDRADSSLDAAARFHIMSECNPSNSDHTYLSIDPSAWQGDLVNAPVYAHVTEDDRFYNLFYWVYFCYNGPTVGGYGSHESDLEHVTIRIEKTTSNLHDMYFAGHGQIDGMWKKASDIEFAYPDRPLVYSAKISHAMFPRPSCYVYACGASIDSCDAKGKRWDPVDNIVTFTATEPAWMLYSGKLSQKVDTLAVKLSHKDSEVDLPKKTSNTWYRRFFGCTCILKSECCLQTYYE